MEMEERAVRDIKIDGSMSVDQLVRAMSDSGGFTAKKLADAIDVMEKMVRDEHCLTFLSFPACIMATGTRGVIVELVKRKLVDVVITTCGTLDHDLARSWKDYYHGDFAMDEIKQIEKYDSFNQSELKCHKISDEKFKNNRFKKYYAFCTSLDDESCWERMRIS